MNRKEEIRLAIQDMPEEDLVKYIVMLEENNYFYKMEEHAQIKPPLKEKKSSKLDTFLDWTFKTVIIFAILSIAYREKDQAWANVFITMIAIASRLGATWEIDKKLKKLKESMK